MDWLSSRYNTALEALTAKRTLLVGSVVTACGIVGAWLPQIEWNGKQMFLGIPTWTWWVIVALSALLGIAFEYEHVRVVRPHLCFSRRLSGTVAAMQHHIRVLSVN